MLEVEKDYASKGVAGAGLGTGIAGLSLGVLNALGGLGSLAMNGKSTGCCNAVPLCSENTPVTRYELGQEQKIAELQAAIALRDANTYGDQKMLEMYKYVDGKLNTIENQLCAQAIHNQKTEDSFVLARQDIAAVKSELGERIAMEAERRCCGDNAIVTYVNGTFYPKEIANVETGTEVTPQTLYNPLPKCGCGCK